MNRIVKIISSILISAIVLSMVSFVPPIEAEAAVVDVEINSTRFPDAEFRKYVSTNFDVNSNGILEVSEIKNAKKVIIEEDSLIEDVTGIQLLYYITEFRVLNKTLTKIDLDRRNPKLTKIVISYSGVKSIKLGYRPNLKAFAAYSTSITAINLVGCPNLYYLDLGETSKLKTFDISYCPLILETMKLGDIKESTTSRAYTYMVGTSKHLFRFTYSASKCVTTHPEGSVPVTTQYFVDYRLRNYIYNNCDLDKNYILYPEEISKVKTIAFLSLNNIIKLDGIELLPELESIILNDAPMLTSIDVSANTKLTTLVVNGAIIESLDLSKNINLTHLDLSNTQTLTQLDVSNNPISYLNLTNTSITSIDISMNQSLIKFCNNASKCHESNLKYDIYSFGTPTDSEYVAINVTTELITEVNQVNTTTPTVTTTQASSAPVVTIYEVVIPTPIPTEEPVYNVGEFVSRCYSIAMGREADDEGYEHWTNLLQNGKMCAAQVAFGFVFSAEYLNKNNTNEEFIDDMYSLFFGRVPSESERQNWIFQLTYFNTREDVFYAFANSLEFNNLCALYGVPMGCYLQGIPHDKQIGANCFVARLYRICFGRSADMGGQYGWTSQLVSGEVNGAALAYSFVFSPEFLNREFSNEDYVAQMYRAFFGREADEAGFNAWIQALANGESRENVFYGFAHSQEFINLCAEYGINA